MRMGFIKVDSQGLAEYVRRTSEKRRMPRVQDRQLPFVMLHVVNLPQFRITWEGSLSESLPAWIGLWAHESRIISRKQAQHLHALIHCSAVLTVAVIRPALSSSCCCVPSAMIDHNLELWVTMHPFFLKWLFQAD